MRAAALLTEEGYEVSRPIYPAVYDLLARNADTGDVLRVQVKTVRRRTDRPGNCAVIYATRGDGSAYTPNDVDYMLGIEGNYGYFFKCRSIREYWINTEKDSGPTEYITLG